MLKEKVKETKVEKLMKKPKIFLSPDEKISSVIGKMKKHKTYALPVEEGKKYIGMVTAQEIISEPIHPTTTEIKSLIIHPPLIPYNTSLTDVCDKMWRNNLRAIPIGEDKKLEGILTFWDILDWSLKQEEFKNLKINEIKKREIPTVKKHEEVDKAKIKLRKKEFTHLLIEDKRMNMLIREEDLLEDIMRYPKESMTLGERKGEKSKRLGVETRSVAEKIMGKIKEDNSIYKLLKEMKFHNYSYFVLENSVVTFIDILRYLGDFKERVTQEVVFINESKFDDMTWDQMKMDLQDFLEIYHKKFGKDTILDFRITIRDLHTTGDRTKYIMSAKLLTDLGDFYADKEGWDAIDVFDGLIKAIRKQIWP
jgi:CBS domain-containing protein